MAEFEENKSGVFGGVNFNEAKSFIFIKMSQGPPILNEVCFDITSFINTLGSPKFSFSKSAIGILSFFLSKASIIQIFYFLIYIIYLYS